MICTWKQKFAQKIQQQKWKNILPQLKNKKWVVEYPYSDRNKEIISLVRRTSVTSKSLVRDSPHLSNKYSYKYILASYRADQATLITSSNDKMLMALFV